MDDIDLLLTKMTSYALISQLDLPDDHVEDSLSERESRRFATTWMNVFSKLESLKSARGVTRDSDSRVTQLRESAYLQSFKRWKSPDLAALISDDFGLIGDALVIGFTDPWLNALFDEYLAGQFPHGQLEPRTGGLMEKVK